MRDEILKRLLLLNREFYQTFALSFTETRTRLQPGVVRTLVEIPEDASVLDIGCGHGKLANILFERGHGGVYFGMDSSMELISIARSRTQHPQATYILADLSDPTWADDLPTSFNWIFAFAVLHHLPGRGLRNRIALRLHDLMEENGRFILSNWNFIASPRLRSRVIPWETIGLSEADVESSDYLLDWRRGGYGLRYVHLFDEAELGKLARSAGFRVMETYYSDGEGGRLGLYQEWQRDLGRPREK